MFTTMKMLAVASVLAVTGAMAQPARADHVSLGIGIGVNVRPTVVSGGFIATTPYVPVYSAGSFGASQTFYQPDFYYGGGYYQDGSYVPQPVYYGRPRMYGTPNYYNAPGAYYGPVYQNYRTAPVQYGPRYNGQPSRLTFGPLSRW